MQYIPCGNLDQLIFRTNGSGLPLKQVRTLFIDLLEGLQYLRDSNIVHGDIKPENLLLSKDGHLIISDFGVSWIVRKKKSKKKPKNDHSHSTGRIKRSSSKSSTDTQTSDMTSVSEESIHLSTDEDDRENDIVEENDNNDGDNFGLSRPAQGTIAFEPPEVASGNKRFSKCGHELDLWAAGIVLFYMATAHYPFKGSSFLEFIENISNGVFEDLPGDMDEDLVDLIKSMLAVNPKDRPSIEQILQFPFMKKDLKSKRALKMIENESAFVKGKDGKYHHLGDKYHHDASECAIC